MTEIDTERSAQILEMGATLHSLLSVAAIKQLVIVDDLFAKKDINLEELIAAIQVNPEKFSSVLPGLGDFEKNEIDLIADQTKKNFDNDTEVKERAWAIHSTDSDEEPELDSETMSVLDELLNSIPPKEENITIKRFSGEEWSKESAEFESPECVSSLILIDRNFSREGKGHDFGLTAIAGLLKKSPNNIYCALLSHTIQPGQELEQSDTLAVENGIPKHQFVVISKKRLITEGDATSPDYAGFLHLLRLSMLSGPLQKVRDNVLKHFPDALTLVQEALADWSVFDFDEAVIGSSREEGIWEGETLLRIITTFITKKVRCSVFEDDKVKSRIDYARLISSVNIPHLGHMHYGKVGHMALEYQRTEYYTEGNFINKYHLPISLGDIFDRGDDAQNYVLLAQPCDLMVRGSGRAYDDKKYSRMVPVFEIHSKPLKEPWQGYELPYWYANGESGFVHFPKIHFIRAAIIDLCVLDECGKAVFDSSKGLPGSLTISWQRYLTKVKEIFKKEAAYANSLKKVLDQKTVKIDRGLKTVVNGKVAPCCSNTGKFSATLSNDGFNVNLRRVRRVNSEIATDILRVFARYQSRTAFDQSVFTKDTLERLNFSGTDITQ